MKEYWEQAERLRRRINRKIHEIHLLRQRAEGMNGSGINDMPRTVSPDRSKMEGTVFKIMALEQDIRETQAEYDSLISDMETRINAVQDGDARDLLRKRYLEFLPWSEIMKEINTTTHKLRFRGLVYDISGVLPNYKSLDYMKITAGTRKAGEQDDFD